MPMRMGVVHWNAREADEEVNFSWQSELYETLRPPPAYLVMHE